MKRLWVKKRDTARRWSILINILVYFSPCTFVKPLIVHNLNDIYYNNDLISSILSSILRHSNLPVYDLCIEMNYDDDWEKSSGFNLNGVYVVPKKGNLKYNLGIVTSLKLLLTLGTPLNLLLIHL